MQETDTAHEHIEAQSGAQSEAQSRAAQSRRARRLPGLLFLAMSFLLLILLALLPPFVNVNRFQRRIATSIGHRLFLLRWSNRPSMKN